MVLGLVQVHCYAGQGLGLSGGQDWVRIGYGVRGS